MWLQNNIEFLHVGIMINSLSFKCQRIRKKDELQLCGTMALEVGPSKLLTIDILSHSFLHTT